ncbi:4Fe-4S dicluster domain-containing protein [Thermincola ferriacetica]
MSLGINGVKVTIDREKCERSGGCFAKRACPVRAISYKNGKIIIDGSICLGCGKCQEVCPNKAISVEVK